MTKNVCPGGGLYVVEGEVSLLMTAMRRVVRWSSHSHQDEDQDVLMKSLSTLKAVLSDAKNLSQLEPGVILAPFLEIIRSEETSGPVTSLALVAVYKMISYELIDHEHPTIGSCVEALADAITHARFASIDASVDGVALMRVLQVLRALVLSKIGDNLSDESICEIMISCFRICFETRLSELLRRNAESCLRDIIYHLFLRLPQFVDDTRVLTNMKKMRTNGIDNSTRNKNRKSRNQTTKIKTKQSSNNNNNNNNNDDNDEREETRELLSPVDRIKKNHLATTPITPAGNIVDMQGSLDQGTPDKLDEDNKNIDTSETITTTTTSKNLDENIVNLNETCNIENKNNEFDNKSQSLTDISDEKNINLIQSPTGSVEDLSIDDNNDNIPTILIDNNNTEEYINQQGVRFTPLQQLTPYGSLCIREIFRFLISLCSPLDKQNTEIMTHLGLNLLQVALEISADSLSNFPSLLMLIKDDLCRNIILLLNTERLSILASNFQVSYLLFESQRQHLKFQMEQFIIKLMEIISCESTRITYEQRELSLEAIIRLWRIPGLPAELYLNYDCGLYSTNLYDELIKLLAKNSSSIMGTMYSMQYLSLDAIILLINGIETRCKGLNDIYIDKRHSTSSILPTRDELINIKTKKRLLALGTEKFNENPREGIAKLAKDGLFGDNNELDPKKIAILLKENPMFDKKSIGEYISRRENTIILDFFVKNFDLHNMRVDQALRPFLEAFRLPGESPLISLVMEKFAAHWYDSNGQPFSSKDAAFLLAYGIIMLNVDQHNNNVKRALNPMTCEQFKRNLEGGNGGQNFDEFMLEDIYNSIKNEEIVMPAEHTGLLKDNYLWKILLKRGTSNESIYLKVGNNCNMIDKDLAELSWASIISALCHAYDKSPNHNLQRRISQSFLNCATICSYYNMNSDLDTLIVALCKFTGLATGGEPDTVLLNYGSNYKCQLATRTLFKITHQYGNCMRSSWKNIIDCLQTLYKSKLLPKYLTDGDDFINKNGKISLIRDTIIQKQPPQEQSILSSLYSYIALDTTKITHANEETIKKNAIDSIKNCSIKQIIDESKFLEITSLCSLINALVSVNLQDEDISVFILELLIKITIENRDRVNSIWNIILPHIDNLLTISIRENQQYLLERVAVGILRLSIRLLRSEEFSKLVLPPLIPLTYIPSATHTPLSRQISYGLFELIKTGAANIHTTEDWRVIFNLLECCGAGAVTSKLNLNSVLDEVSTRISVLDQRPISPIPEWVLVSPTGTEAPLPVTADTIVLERDLLSHDPASLVKCCESLNFLIRDVAHITPFNFELCVRCIRTFVEAALQVPGKRNKITQSAMETNGYQEIPLQLLYLMHSLHSGTEKIFKWWAQENGTTEGLSLWPHAWRPLLQGMARLCCDSRRSIRAAAITCLQGELLAHDLTQLTPIEWSQCLEQVIFPLLAQLLGPISVIDPVGVEETRIRAAQLLSKVFLYHLPPLLTLPGFLPLWLTVLDLLKSYMHADNSELLYEAIPESLKNMLLVMASGEAKLTPSSYLWEPTWRTINSFLPNLKSELSIIDQPTKEETIQQQQQQQQSEQLQQQEQLPQLQLQQEQEQQQQQLPQSQLPLQQPQIQLPQPQLQLQLQLQQQQQQQKSPTLSDSMSLINLVEQEQPTFSGSSIAPQPEIISDITSNTDDKIPNKNIPHMTNEDTMDTTMFNSAAYFSEDPAADRLFIVTNP